MKVDEHDRVVNTSWVNESLRVSEPNGFRRTKVFFDPGAVPSVIYDAIRSNCALVENTNVSNGIDDIHKGSGTAVLLVQGKEMT